MAIGYARLEYVKRSSGKNAVAKSAYNSRQKLEFHGNHLSDPKIYDWSRKEPTKFHKIFLPDNVDKKFLSPEILWNYVEKFETKKNAVVQNEIVLALPDDHEITLDDRVKLVESFVSEHFVSKGFAVQVDIHPPEKNSEKSDEEYENSNGHNWHAHVLITTRRFLENGQDFEKNKPREYTTSLRGGRVVSGPNWGKIWTNHQNEYFEEKGISLRVDPVGIVSQRHLGPIRMRAQAVSLFVENFHREELNDLESEKPSAILKKILENKSVFTKEDADKFIYKNVSNKNVEFVKDLFWKQGDIVELICRKNKVKTKFYTSKAVIEEEKQILRIADRLNNRLDIHRKIDTSYYTSNLSQEQKVAFESILKGPKIFCIEGYAGTGKSYLLVALKNFYQSQGKIVRALGPDNATVSVLKEKGFENAENIHRFLFSHHYGNKKPSKEEEVWVVDEASKIGNASIMELLKYAEKNNAKVIFSGCNSQHRSVDRGGAFGLFCDQFGSVKLEDIQRQKFEMQKKMAESLAKGRMSEAIDILEKSDGIIWSITKQDSLESLMDKWCKDRDHFSDNKGLIIAYTNAEVRALNELVRTYLKAEKEIEEKEFSYLTPFGEILISVGDRIQFRKNNKEIGVLNGMTGRVLNASDNHCLVSVVDGKKTKIINFNPREYSHFHAAYATTSYRSQGDTADRVYVYHSKRLGKEDFYVDLTRHKRKVYLFASREEMGSVAELKLHANKTNFKPITLDFLTKEQLREQAKKKDREDSIRSLKDSNSIFSKLKGYGMETVDGFISGSQDIFFKYKDRFPSNSFFNPDLKNSEAMSKRAIALEKVNKSSVSEPDNKKNNRIVVLSDHEKVVISDYYKSLDRSSFLYSVVLSETESSDRPKEVQPHFKEWQKTCAERNKKAYEITNSFDSKKLKSFFSDVGANSLLERAQRHEKKLFRANGSVDLEAGLRSNLDHLLFRLFPDGPTRKERNALRFGSKCSLRVDTSGFEYGRFYDFENGVGGGLLKLIETKMGFTKEDAISWSKSFLGEGQPSFIPKSFSKKIQSRGVEEKWKSAVPVPTIPAPPLSILSKTLSKTYQESARYAYCDKNGSPLFYVLRLVNKENNSEKIVLPLSFGSLQGRNESNRWLLKAYSNSERPIYNQNLLYENPFAKVLIVEGEKSADSARKIFPELVCVTWSGGASAVNKTDWSVLNRRDVVIWPDNDNAGYKASESLCSQLRRVGAKSISIVDKELLSSFPEKWDLADPLPERMDVKHLEDLMLRSKEKKLDVDQILVGIGINISEADPKSLAIERERVNGILYRIEERLWDSLESKHYSKSSEIKNEIYSETIKIIHSQKEISEILKSDFKVSKQESKELSYKMVLNTAQTGFFHNKDSIKSGLSDLSYRSKDEQVMSNICKKELEITVRELDKVLEKEISI